MKREFAPIRPTMTAIAAAMVLSSTPLLAQTTDASAGQVAPAAPVVEAPPAPASSAAVSADAQPAPAVAAAPAVSPAPAMRTMSTPVEHTGDDGSATPAAAPRASASLTSGAGTAHSVAHAAAPKASSPAVSAKVSAGRDLAAPKPVAREATLAPAKPAAAQVAATPAAAPTATRTTVQASRQSDDATLPIAGGVALGLLAVGGAAYALGRRRDERDEDELVLGAAEREPVAAPAPVQPAVVESAPVVRSAAIAAGAAAVPAGFNVSRFGRHTQAAYRGPTPDNPFLSLKRRLKRASFLDQREREGGVVPQAPLREETATQAVAQSQRDDGQITVRLNPRRQSNGFGYAFQR